jgi:hypothetical protein
MAAGWAQEGFIDLYASITQGLGELTIGLYQAGPPPATPVDPAAYTLCTWNGYQAFPLGPWPTAELDMTQPQALFTWPQHSWTAGSISAAQPVNGWYVEDAAGNWLMAHDVSPPLSISTAGQVVSLTLSFEVNGGSLGRIAGQLRELTRRS